MRDPAKAWGIRMDGWTGAAHPGRVLSLKREREGGGGKSQHVSRAGPEDSSGKKPIPAPGRAGEAGPQPGSKIGLKETIWVAKSARPSLICLDSSPSSAYPLAV